MKLSEKVKVALEETRILILGAQILPGFGFRGVFDDRFDQLSAYARYADGVGLGLLVCAIGLLIAPGPYHRIVERGQDSGRLHRFATVIADLALLPFALALGLGLFVGIEAIFDDSAASIAAGMTGAGLALALWYGLPRLRKRFVGERERMITRGQSNERADTPPQAKIEQLLTEARVVLPGAQALFGFQLAIVLTSLRAITESLDCRACGQPFAGRARRHDADGSGPLSQDRLCRRGTPKICTGSAVRS
jgi:Family of unknown function (DUF6328)